MEPQAPPPSADPDAVVIGSGPNGLVAACILAKAGLSVLVLETNPQRFGGAVGTVESTLPGFKHDVGAAFFPWGGLSQAFAELELEDYGLVWKHAEFESCHPAPDGSYACISRDNDVSAKHFGTPADGDRWREVASYYQSIEKRLLPALMDPFPPVKRGLALAAELPKLATIFGSKGRWLAERWFKGVAARRVMPGLALHVDVGPDDWFGAALGYMLGMTATTGGYVVPEGGAQSLTDSMVGYLRAHGGRLQLASRVDKILTQDRSVCAVRLADGTEIRTKLVFADTDIEALLTRMVDPDLIPGRLYEFANAYPRGWGTFKMDWALSGPVPWAVEVAQRSAVVHAGDSLADLSKFTREVRGGNLPSNPYLVIGQQSIADPTRAPQGAHTLWAYSRVPPRLAAGWDVAAEGFADRIEERIEALAPGFRAKIRARAVVSPPDLQAMDANLVGGDLGGGSNAWHRQLMFRPLFPHFRYEMPIAGLHLCSSYAHPGAGVHGMCGYNAAQLALA